MSNDYATRMYVRNPAIAGWHIRTISGPKDLVLRNSDAANGAITSNTFDVSPAEIYSYSLFVGNHPTGPIIRSYVQWLEESGAQVGIGSGIIDTDAIGSYKEYGVSDLVSASGASKGRLVIHVRMAGSGATTDWALITSIELSKVATCNFVSAATIETVQKTVVNNDIAFINYRSTSNTRFNNIETNVSSQATVISQRETIASVSQSLATINQKANANLISCRLVGGCVWMPLPTRLVGL